MADLDRTGDRPANPPSDLELSSSAQLRIVLQRVDALEARLQGSPSPAIRLADGLSLLGIIIAVATVLATGLGLSGRIDHVDTASQHAVELVGQKVDRLNDAVGAIARDLAVDQARRSASHTGSDR